MISILSKNRLNKKFTIKNSIKSKISKKNFQSSFVLKSENENWDFFSSTGNLVGNELGAKLGKVDWESMTLGSVKKDVYVENESVALRSKEKVEEFRKVNNIQFLGKNKPANPVLSFDELNIEGRAKKRLMAEFEKPTPIQSNVWPIIMKGEDLVGSAETGSGKTLAFLIPLFEHIVAQSDIEAWPKALVIAPTRELVKQIHAVAEIYARDYKITTLYAHGGSQNRKKQENDIRLFKPELLIASPGRVIDFVENGLISLEKVSMLVLDEADSLLQMGFESQVKMILSQVRPDKQALMFSATWPSNVQHLARKYFKNFVHLNIGSLNLSANPRITQNFILTRAYKEKKENLINLLTEQRGKIVVFVNTKSNCENIKLELGESGIKQVGSLHGDHTQTQRETEINNFHSGETRILLCTDLAARGIDVKDITCVINFDMPETVDTYIHRIGRTARAENSGASYSLVSPADVGLVPELVKILKDANQEVPAQFESALSQRISQRQIHQRNERDGLRIQGVPTRRIGGDFEKRSTFGTEKRSSFGTEKRGNFAGNRTTPNFGRNTRGGNEGNRNLRNDKRKVQDQNVGQRLKNIETDLMKHFDYK